MEQIEMKTKVTYELVEDLSSNEIAKAMIDGEVFYDPKGTISFCWDGDTFRSNKSERIGVYGCFYRRVETPIEWWEDLDSLSFPIALFSKASDEIVSFNKEEFEHCRKLHEYYRPATKAELQVLLDNAPED
jgi:hypothetical protein